MASIDDANPIVVLDTPQCLSNLIRKYGLNRQEEYDRGSLARYAESILQIARDVMDYHDDNEEFKHMVAERIDIACSYIGAYEDMRPRDRLLSQKTKIANDITKVKSEMGIGKLKESEIYSKLRALEMRYEELRRSTENEKNFYFDALQTSVELISAFITYCLQYNLRNVKTYIAHLNDYQMSIEIYRL